jgi:RNA polymerase sigma-70 factor (ECF subfamily)
MIGPEGDDFAQRLSAARTGDRSELGRLFEAARPQLADAARSLVGPGARDRVRTSDLVQSALLEGLQDLESFRGGTRAEFASWLHRILENNLRDRDRYFRAVRRGGDRRPVTCELDELVGAREPRPADAAVATESLVQLSQAIGRLARDHQRILLLCVTRGLSHEEVGEVMGRSEGASRVLLARARASLLVELDKLRRAQRAVNP